MICTLRLGCMWLMASQIEICTLFLRPRGVSLGDFQQTTFGRLEQEKWFARQLGCMGRKEREINNIHVKSWVYVAFRTRNEYFPRCLGCCVTYKQFTSVKGEKHNAGGFKFVTLPWFWHFWSSLGMVYWPNGCIRVGVPRLSQLADQY